MRIKGSFSAQMCSDAISKKLKEFDLDFPTEYVSIMTVCIAMTIKHGWIISPFKQWCYVNGIHIVYKIYSNETKLQVQN